MIIMMQALGDDGDDVFELIFLNFRSQFCWERHVCPSCFCKRVRSDPIYSINEENYFLILSLFLWSSIYFSFPSIIFFFFFVFWLVLANQVKQLSSWEGMLNLVSHNVSI